MGGGVQDLPDRYRNHPSLLLWDDEKGMGLVREVPKNTRAILWNRWISHATAGRLNIECAKRRIPKYPNLRTRDIKALLADIVGEYPRESVMEQQELSASPEAPVTPVASTSEDRPKKKRGDLKKFIAQHANWDIDYKIRGSILTEARRLYEAAIAQGLSTTLDSVSIALGNLVRDMGMYEDTPAEAPKRPEPEPEPIVVAKPSTKIKGKDDFEQLDALIDDALTALSLIKEHLPKVRKETDRLRGLREKMQSILNVED